MTTVAFAANPEMIAEMSDHAVANSSSLALIRMVEQVPVTSVPVRSLVTGFHLRQSGTDAAHVRLLADAAGSVRLPAILVQRDGSRVIDGLHRLEVAKLRGERTISARVVDCSDEEALILAVNSNTLHGLPLSRSDRIASARRILGSHPDWSDRAVAEITGVSAKAIASLRNNPAGGVQFSGKRLGRDGKRRPVMGAEVRKRAADYINAHPDASIRQIARETDVSIGTAQDVRKRLRRGAGYLGQAARASIVPAAESTSPPAPARILPRRTRTANIQRLAWTAFSAKLAGDPALRYTEGGRAFLRWMDGHCMKADEWREFIGSVPRHWRAEMSRMAAAMSEEWREFAEHLSYEQDAVS